ncbi:MAG: hypothetical protein EWV83_20330, partial [Microcystis sp. M_OC_Ca_00000000_S217Cul]
MSDSPLIKEDPPAYRHPPYQGGQGGSNPPYQGRAVSFSHQNIKSKSDHCLCKMRSERELLKDMLSLIEKL